MTFPARPPSTQTMRTLIVVVVVASMSVAHADPQHARLSEITATALSAGGLGVSVAIIAIGAELARADIRGPFDSRYTLSALWIGAGAATLLVTPSLGHWYAGTYVTHGMALRLGGSGLAVAGALAVLDNCIQGCSSLGGGLALFVFGSLVAACGAVDDVLTAAPRVRRHNARLSPITLAPVALDRGAGAAILGRF